MAVTLQEILEAREHRVSRQQTLLAEHRKPLLCFTMNIAGPDKYSELIARGFHLGLDLLDAQLRSEHIPVSARQVYTEATGCEAFYIADADARRLKQLAVQIEDTHPAGRLFDMDVLTPEGSKLSRESLGLPGRVCLICGGPVHICSRSRAHSVQELQAKTTQLLQNALWQQEAEQIGTLAVKSLLYEVCASPKPGLVDRHGNGSHKDMDIFTFLGSCAALQPYFTACARTGLEEADSAPGAVFEKLRFLGRQAEQTMYAATGGVNTHKGAIFTLGLLCAAMGSCDAPSPEQICQRVAAMTRGLTKTGFTGNATTGEQLFASHGITGIRGQAEAGFPALLDTGLPILEAGLNHGLSLEEAGCATLLHLMCAITDTNLIARSNPQTQKTVCEEVRNLLENDPYPSQAQLLALDAEFIRKNLSPGGSADLLAATYFLYFCKTCL